MKKTDRSASIVREIAVFLLLLWAFSLALIMAFAPASRRAEYAVLIFAMDVAVLLGFMSSASICTVLCGTLSCVWVSYKLYMFYIAGSIISLVDYIMILMPLLGMLSVVLFEKGLRGIDKENSLLHKQVEELVLVDEMTGLYNLRALYKDLQSMVSYGERNSLPICIMVIQMRYEEELSSMLPRRKYIQLCQALAKFVCNNVRMEDRTYAIDGKGTLAIILTASKEDSDFVRRRLLHALTETDAFDDILERGTMLQLRIACKEYDKAYGKDMMRFKGDAESELIYDV